MPERGLVPAVLIDGPSVGQVIHTAPEVTAWYVRKPPEPLELSPTLNLSHWVLPEPTVYRFEWRTACLEVPGSPHPALLRLRFGWSEPGEANDDAIRRYGRAALLEHPELIPAGAVLWPADPADDEPIRVLDHGHGPFPGCRDIFEMHPRTRLIRGTCPCGWRTEDVESRRFEELGALTAEHGRAGAEALEALARRGPTVRRHECGRARRQRRAVGAARQRSDQGAHGGDGGGGACLTHRRSRNAARSGSCTTAAAAGSSVPAAFLTGSPPCSTSASRTRTRTRTRRLSDTWPRRWPATSPRRTRRRSSVTSRTCVPAGATYSWTCTAAWSKSIRITGLAGWRRSSGNCASP